MVFKRELIILEVKSMEDGYGKCHQCRKFGTSECPTSSKCLMLDDRPYFEPKEKKKFTISKGDKLSILLLLLYILAVLVSILNDKELIKILF
jgi:hypothetical protein